MWSEDGGVRLFRLPTWSLARTTNHVKPGINLNPLSKTNSLTTPYYAAARSHITIAKLPIILFSALGNQRDQHTAARVSPTSSPPSAVSLPVLLVKRITTRGTDTLLLNHHICYNSTFAVPNYGTTTWSRSFFRYSTLSNFCLSPIDSLAWFDWETGQDLTVRNTGNVNSAFAILSSTTSNTVSEAVNKVSAADPKQIARETATWMNENRVETAVYGVCGLSVAAPGLIAGPVLGLTGFGSGGIVGGMSISTLPWQFKYARPSFTFFWLSISWPFASPIMLFIIRRQLLA